MADNFSVLPLYNKNNPQPGAYIPPSGGEQESAFSPGPFANHLIQGYNIGLYTTPGEVLDHIKYVRKTQKDANTLLPLDFEDAVLRSMGFTREQAHPSLPYTIQRLSDTAKPPAG